MKNEMLYAAIGAADDGLLNRCESRVKDNPRPIRRRHWAWVLPTAACLALVVAVTAIFGNNLGWFGSTIYTAELDGGTLSFYKSSTPDAACYAYAEGEDVSMRSLTQEEREMLYFDAFGDLDFYAEGAFALGDRWGLDTTLIHVTAGSGSDGSDQGYDDVSTKIIMSQDGNSIAEMQATKQFQHMASVINGVQVSAGYFITHENSRGERSVIYMASYEVNGNNVYIECGGSLERSDEIRAEIARITETLTLNSGLNLMSIVY
ncbi:MAG: hypothetical protein FWH04_02660 [Oscillospiraceae bacterium]|nr:hypothetical protein [Oscillospiraceae bacterium]